MLKWENGCIVDISPEEEEAIKAALEAYNKKELKRPLEQHEVFQLLAKKMVNTVTIDDETTLRMKDYYPTFEEITGTEVEAGFKFTYQGEMWKTRQKHTVQEIYPPSVDTASLYERINETNAGTLEDPIPYDMTMRVYEGIYYLYEGEIYKCIRDSGIPLYATPDTLLNNFFELAGSADA